MRKIITMVGTSLFENFLKEKEGDTNYEYFKEKQRRFNDLDHEKSKAERLKSAVKSWLEEFSEEEKLNASAEIKSLYKLKEELKDEFEIFLLSSDTILSYLAGEIIKEVIEELEIGNVHLEVVKGLQIWDREEFKKGMSELIDKIYQISGGFWENIVINITGGFKATIPFLTILAQLNGCPVYYIFEDTDALIKIPNIPFSKELIDWKEFDRFYEHLVKLEKGITEEKEYHNLKNSEFYQKYSFLIWEDPPLAELNPIGKIFFEKYKEKFFVFYGTEEVEKEMMQSPELKKLLIKFSNIEIRKNKTEIKNGHMVFDDGNNQRRIFYIVKNNQIYIYKIFGRDKEEYFRFLETPFSSKLLESFNFKLIKLAKEE